MALTASTMLPLGTAAPDFALPDTEGRMVRLADFKSCDALLVAFICNHCPYVKHIAGELARLGKEYQAKNVGVVAIQSNDIKTHPQDGPGAMKQEKQSRGYTFPYLLDADQSVAKAYRAACTPDFYVFDRGRKLVYRGQFDDTRPGGAAPTGRDLRAALDAALAGAGAVVEQKPSMGCNIKWTAGKEPEYFRA